MDALLTRIVEYPEQPPYKCFLCQSNKGPIMDTDIILDAPGRGYAYERVYICKTCARIITRTFGFSKGKNLEQIESAIEVLAEKDKEIREREEMFQDAMHQLGNEKKLNSALESEVERLKGKVAQLEHVAKHVRETAEELLTQPA